MGHCFGSCQAGKGMSVKKLVIFTQGLRCSSSLGLLWFLAREYNILPKTPM